MLAKYILALLSAVFFTAAAWRLWRDRGRTRPASKAWLLVAAIFALVSAWVW
jgi:hypothetical protein